jgi:hypothetical protein
MTWHRSGSSSAYVRMVRDSGSNGPRWRRGSSFLRSRHRSRLSGGTPSEMRDFRVCLGVDRAPKTPLVDIEPKRCEGLR